MQHGAREVLCEVVNVARGAKQGHIGAGRGPRGAGRGRLNTFDYNNAESIDNDESLDTCSSSDSGKEEVTHARIDDTCSDSDGAVSAEENCQ